MTRNIKIIFLFLRQAFMREMAYPANFWFLFLLQIVSAGVQLIGIEIVFSHTDALGEWSKGEAIAFIAVFGFVVSGLRVFFEQSFLYFCADVHSGTFDFALIRPVDARIAVSFRAVSLSHIGGILFNVVLLFWLIASGMIHITFQSLIGFFGLTILGFIAGYALWFALTLLAFWAPSIEHFGYLYGVVVSIVRFPLDIYGRIARKFFLTLLPLGFLVTVPTEYLLGRGTGIGILIAIGVVALLFFVVHYWWQFAIRHYSSASG